MEDNVLEPANTFAHMISAHKSSDWMFRAVTAEKFLEKIRIAHDGIDAYEKDPEEILYWVEKVDELFADYDGEMN